MNDRAYCNRDLSLTSTAYHKKLEAILVKCTRVRDQDPIKSDRYYHSYKELRRDIADARDSMPAIVREEDVKVRCISDNFGDISQSCVQHRTEKVGEHCRRLQ